MSESMKKTFLAESDYLTAVYRQKYADQLWQPQNLKVYKDTALVLEQGSMVELIGSLELHAGCKDDYHRSSIMHLSPNAKLIVGEGSSKICYGADIEVLRFATLQLGSNVYIDSNTSIRCGKKIVIGDGTVISRNVNIMDSDFHTLIRKGEPQPKYGEEVVIGNRVWIGEGAKILKNVHIGDGAVIAAGAIVTRDVPARALVAGVPAAVIDTDVDWEV